MPDLGSFGEAVTADPDTFTYFGSALTIRPEFGPLDLMDWIEMAGSLDDQSAEGYNAVKDLARLVFGDSYDEFWATAKRNRQTQEQVMEAVQAVVAAQAKRPTLRSSDSSDGPQVTEEKSEPDLPSSVQRQVLKHEMAGRPDLALMILETAQARAS